MASSSHPARPAENLQNLQAGEPAAKVRKLAEVAKPVSIATPLRNSILPDGADWSGVTVVFASDLSSVAQAAVEKQILQAGGKVGAAISQRTSLVVLGGNLPDGRPPMESAKYQRFLDLQSKGKVQAKVLSEAAFLSLLPAQPPAASFAPAAIKTQSSMPPQKLEPPQSAKQLESSKSSSARNWVDIFSPKKLEDFLGNQAPIRKLADWLQDWEDVVLRGKSKKLAFRHGSVPDNLNARAALVSGPPGIGKTTTCRLVAQLQGRYEVLEFNASDSRGQKVIQEMAAGIAENTTISFAGGRQGQRKVVIIMDEVDGMGGGDKGGIAALVKMIKRTRNPIICICNDQHTQQVRSLASSCYDLKFIRPPKNAIALRCAQIARQQGLQVDVAAVEAIVESSGNDVRVVLNHLQMMKAGRLATPSCSILTESPGRLGKDQEVILSPFDVCRKLLTSSEATSHAFQARFEMFFVDHSLVSMLVHENYLRSIERQPVSSEVLNRCAYSADLMTIGDMMSQRMVVEQEWSFLPHCAAVACAYPTFVTRGSLAYPSFPSIMGKMSSRSKSRRLVSELQTHIRLAGTADRKALVTSSYMDLMYKRLVQPLQRAEIQSVVSLLDAYGLRKEHMLEHLTELRQPLGCQDLFKQVDAKVKAALTRELNSGRHAVRVLPTAKRRRHAEDTGGDDMEEREVEASDEEDAADALVKVKSAKAKAKAKTKGKSGKATSQGST